MLLSLMILYSTFSLLNVTLIFSCLSFSFKIVTNSSWLISMSINAWDINLSMLLSLLLASRRIWSCFYFLFLSIFSNFLTIPVVREKIKVRLVLAIPAGARTILVNEIINTALLGARKTIKVFLWLISW